MTVFDRIYQGNEWNGIETRSGPGSHKEPTRRVAATIVQLVELLGVRSVLDVGCGEGSWMPDLPGYLGIDVAREAIEAARRNHPERRYLVWDSLRKPVPWAHLIVCRDVMQHLSQKDGVRLMENMTGSGTFLLASTYIDGENERIDSGGDAYRVNLQAKPFSMPPPLLYVPDGYVYHDGDVVRDAGKMLALWRL